MIEELEDEGLRKMNELERCTDDAVDFLINSAIEGTGLDPDILKKKVEKALEKQQQIAIPVPSSEDEVDIVEDAESDGPKIKAILPRKGKQTPNSASQTTTTKKRVAKGAAKQGSPSPSKSKGSNKGGKPKTPGGNRRGGQNKNKNKN